MTSSFNVLRRLVDTAQMYPQKVAVTLDDQTWTYCELIEHIERVTRHLHRLNIVQGQIIYQFVERSFEMICGLFGIMYAGGIYYALSPTEPSHRLVKLMEQLQGQYVLVHEKTRNQLPSTAIRYIILLDDILHPMYDIKDMDNPLICSEYGPAYIICSSGTTGQPKAILHTHRSFSASIAAYVQWDGNMYTVRDQVLQVAGCLWALHLLEITLALVVGGTLVLLRPGGHMNMDYFSRILIHQQVTTLTVSSGIIRALTNYIEMNKQFETFNFVRNLCVTGEMMKPQQWTRLIDILSLSNVQLSAMYGMSECNFAIGCQLLSINNTAVPIGHPFPSIQCLLINEQGQKISSTNNPNEIGQIHIGGPTLFNCYVNDSESTDNVFVTIDDRVYIKTGDLARYNIEGELVYVGRIDFQIKIHGQRVEPAEIENTIMNWSPSKISNCLVTKAPQNDDLLVAYIISNDSEIDTKQIRDYCNKHLRQYMVPSVFIVLEQFPLNPNGKIDRKRLPIPQFSSVTNIDSTDLLTLTPLEEKLHVVFSQAFHNESPNVDMSFGEMGGTSLDAIQALWIIRQEICSKVDADLLFKNPSIRQLARAIEPLLITHHDSSVTSTTLQLKEEQDRLMPSLYIEMLGILFLMYQWFLPIWLVCQSDSFLTVFFIPIFHLLSYVVCQRLLFNPGEIQNKIDQLYSWHYYRWWFLKRLWVINNSYWLKCLFGTVFYNFYLQLCGAKIGYHTQIYTMLIDAPWLLEVGDSTFIGEEVVVANLSYQDITYRLDRIQIGSQCSINPRCVLYEEVIIKDGIFLKPMSVITGPIATLNDNISVKDRSVSLNKIMYQFICLLCLLFIHSILLLLAYLFYHYCRLTLLLPLPMSVALAWLVWAFISLFIVLFLLKFIVGSVTLGQYPLNSYYYMHKLWLRQIIISSFHHSFNVIPLLDNFPSIFLRWLGAHTEDDIKLSDMRRILYFPSNLLHIEHGVTTFAGVIFHPFELTKEGYCCVDKIHLGSGTNITNGCLVMPGTRIPSKKIIIGMGTLVTRETVVENINGVLFGIPAREMPFIMSDDTYVVNELSSSNFQLIHSMIIDYLSFFISKCLFITLYTSLPIAVASFIHAILYCVASRNLIVFREKRTRFAISELLDHTQQFLRTLISDFFVFIGPYLSETQFLVFLYRAIGAEIGSDVILPDIFCVSVPHLTTIGDHVRLSTCAYIQNHTFERRIFKMAPVTVKQSSVLMSYTIALPGSTLQGQNRILPWTVVMKGDQLPPGTTWAGAPSKQIF